MFGDCPETGRVKYFGKKIQKVLAPNREESKLYKDILSHIQELPKETIDVLKEQYRSWVDKGIIPDVDDIKSLALGLYAQTHSSNFKKWFGDSKVVDENGEPLIVYHGSTSKNINVFKAQHPAKNADILGTKPGLFFTDNIQYAKEVKQNDTIYPVFLSSKNPDLENREEIDHITAEQSNERGYDGLIGIDYGQTEGKTYVVFDASQIKSLFNQGQYSTPRFEGDFQQSSVHDYGMDPLTPEGAKHNLARKEDIENKGGRVSFNGKIKVEYDPNNIYFQDEQLKSSEASLPTQEKVVEWAKRMGYDIKKLTEGMLDDKGNKITPENSIDFFDKLIKVVDGDNTALTHEVVHIATRMIKDRDPKLYKEMLNRIDKYQAYIDVVSQYKTNKAYQLEDGKLNIPKLKEEAINYVLTEHYIKQEEGTTEKPELTAQLQSWWKRILDGLKSMFSGNGYNPFKKAAKELSEEKGVFEDPNNIVNNLTDKKKEETYQDTKNRIYNNIEKLTKDLPDKTAIVTHGTVLNILKTDSEDGFYKLQDDKQGSKNGEVVTKQMNNKTFYFIRHGESEANLNDTRNTPETPLTKKGEEQAKETAQFLKDKGITNIMSTDTNRTKSTASILRKELGIEDKLFQQNKSKGQLNFERFKDKKGLERVEKTTAEGEKTHDYQVNGQKVEKKASDFGKAVYEDAFKNKEISEDDKKENKQLADFGTKGHADIEDIFGRYIDKETGLKRKKPLPKTNVSQLDPNNNMMYVKLESYVNNLLSKYPETTRFAFEEIGYKPGKDGKVGKGDIAATFDFLIFEENGSVHNLDWKFKLHKEGETDIKPVSKKAYQAQLSAHYNILRDGLGFDNIVENRIIPLAINKLKTDIEIWDKDYKELPVNQDYLLPVASPLEQHKNERLNILIKQLNTLLEEMQKAPVKASDRIKKAESLDRLSQAIRYLQVKDDVNGVISFGKTFVDNKLNDIKKYEEIIKGNRQDEMSEDDINKASMDLIEAYVGAQTYTKIPQAFIEHLQSMVESERKPLVDSLNSLAARATALQDKIFDSQTKKGIISDFGEKLLANRNNVFGLLKSEANVPLLTKWTTTLSSARTKSTQVLSKLVGEAWNRISLSLKEETNKLEEHKESIKKWMGGSFTSEGKNKLRNTLFQKDSDGKWIPELVGKYSREFYKTLKEKQNSKDITWIKDNIDTEAYKEKYEKDLENYSEYIRGIVYDPRYDIDSVENISLQDQIIERFKDKYDLERTSAFSIANDKLYRFPLDKHHSTEYKEMLNNKPLLDLYNYIIDNNKKAHEMGLFSNYQMIRKFPQIRKGVVESLSHGIDGSSLRALGESVVSSFILEPGDHGYIDPITGEPQDKIFARYMTDLANTIGGKKDYSNVSDDIFEVLTMWNGEMLKYQYLTDIESKAKMLAFIEGAKNRLITDTIGRIIKKDGLIQEAPNNASNFEYYKKMQDYALYGKKYSGEKLGFSFKHGDKDYFFSVPKTVDSINRYISLKVLGVNPATAASNFFGGTANAYINAGKYFTRKELNQSQYNIVQAKFNTGEGAKLVDCLDYFVPFTENLSRELGKDMTLSQAKRYLSSDGIMTFMRKSDNYVQMMVSDAFFRNTIINNGKFVNIRDFVKEKNNFDNIYSLPEGDRKLAFDKIEKEVKEYQKQNLYSIGKYSDKGVTFDGIDKEEAKFVVRNQIMQFTRDCLGNRTPEELAQMNMTMLGSSMTMFKNWIPRLAQKRFGELAYNPGSNSYDYGRVRMLGNVLKGNVFSGLKDITGYMFGSESAKGNIIDKIKEQYQLKVQKQREIEQIIDPNEQSMFEKITSEADFIDNYLRGLKAQCWELAGALSLTAAWAAAKANPPSQDDDYITKGGWRYSVRMLDKFSDELAFFYSPFSALSITGIQGQGVFPLASLVADIERFMNHASKELWYDLRDEEDKSDKNHVVKYILNDIPVEKELNYWISLFDEDYAKLLGTQQKSTNYSAPVR